MPKQAKTEICNECGRSVRLGSGRFVNRVLSLDSYQTHKQMNKPFPEGKFMCAECDEHCPLES